MFLRPVQPHGPGAIADLVQGSWTRQTPTIAAGQHGPAGCQLVMSVSVLDSLQSPRAFVESGLPDICTNALQQDREPESCSNP